MDPGREERNDQGEGSSTEVPNEAMERLRIRMKLEAWFKVLQESYPGAHRDDYLVDDPNEALELLKMDIEITRHYRRVCLKLTGCTPAEGMAVTDNGTAGPSRRDQGKGSSTTSRNMPADTHAHPIGARKKHVTDNRTHAVIEILSDDDADSIGAPQNQVTDNGTDADLEDLSDDELRRMLQAATQP